MSDTTEVVTRGLIEYLAARTSTEDALLADLKVAARAAGIPNIWIPPEEGSLIQILLRLTRAREVVEVGTLAGYSAIWMARALPEDGRVRTIELSPKHAAFARTWIAKSDVAQRVHVLEGRGSDVLRTIETGVVDAVFIDADKGGYADYVEQAARILRTGGLLLVDNAFAFGQILDAAPADRDAPVIQSFNERLARDTRFQTIIVPLGDGLWVGTKLT